MSTNKSDPAARQYARALYELGREQQAIGQVWEELQALGKAYREDRVFRLFFTSPKVSSEVKERIIKEILSQAHVITRHFIGLLIHKHREALLDNIVDSFAKHRDEAENRMHVWLESARPFSEQDRSLLVTRLKETTGKEVVLHEISKPELIGGIRLRIGDRLLDASLKQRLKLLTQKLLNTKNFSLETSGISSAQAADQLYQRFQQEL